MRVLQDRLLLYKGRDRGTARAPVGYGARFGTTRTKRRDPTESTAGTVAVHASLGSRTTFPPTFTALPEMSRSAARRLCAKPALTKSSEMRLDSPRSISTSASDGISLR